MLNAFYSIFSPNYTGVELYEAAASGNLDKVSEITNSIYRPNFSSIRKDNSENNMLIVCGNNTEIANILLDNYSNKISTNAKGQALENAALHDRGQVVELLLNRCSEKISAEYKGWALEQAAEQGHHQIVEHLLNRCSAKIDTGHKSSALWLAAEHGHLAALNALLANESVLALAARRNNRILRDAQMRANAGPEDAARYQPIINRLMLIPAVAQLAAQQQGMTLAEMVQFSENSMMALSESEKSLLNNLKKYYKESYTASGGWNTIQVEMISYLENAYQKHPALNEKGEALPLEFTDTLSEASNIAYYKHSIHTAWRYFSRPNPWISPGMAAIISDADKEIISYLWIALNDESVTLDPNFSVEGNKNIFIETIASLARSHNRDARSVINSEGVNISTTADDMAADKPSCSWGVKKALFQGVYGHPYINCPEAQSLSPEIMLARMIERLVKRNGQKDSQANIEDKLDELSIKQLEEIKNKLINLFATLDPKGKEEEIKIPELQISKVQLDAFIENAKLWFSAQRIEAKQCLRPNSMGNDEYSTHPCNNYIELIRHYASNPEQAFAMHLMNKYLTQRIEVLRQESVNPHAILHSFSLLSIRDQDEQLEYEELEINTPHRNLKPG